MRVLLLPLLLVGMALAHADPRVLSWEELVPEGVAPGLPGGAELMWPEEPMSYSPEAFKVNSELNDTEVRIPGFIVPLESDEGGLLNEFFLVPYFGACIHVPPPPPNQIVYVRLDEAFNLESMWEPFWIEGTLKTENYTAAIGASAYTLQGTKVEKYEY